MSAVYVAICIDHSESDPGWIVGAYSTADNAKDACEADAAHYIGSKRAPAITWQRDPAGLVYWTRAEPYGYRISRKNVDDRPEPDDITCASADED